MDAQVLNAYNNGKPLTKETDVNETPLPKYFMDASGYCYAATELLAKKSGLTPWNGAVDAAGFAVTAPEPAPQPKPKASRQQAKRPVVQQEPED